MARLLEKSFSTAVLTLLASSAYFQASAATRLLADRWLGPQVPVEPRAREAARPARTLAAASVRARNPFDSLTGPLDAQTPHDDDPLRAPVCDDAELLIVSDTKDPSTSLATLRGAGVRRVGEEAGGRRVELIGYNPQRSTPTVWLSREGAWCQAPLFHGERSSLSASSGSRSEISGKVRKLSDTEFELERSTFEDILAAQSALMASTRIVPEARDGKVVGVRLFGVRPGGVLSAIGLQNGDRLDTINGFRIAEPERALQAFAQLRRASRFDLRIERRGAPLALTVHVR